MVQGDEVEMQVNPGDVVRIICWGPNSPLAPRTLVLQIQLGRMNAFKGSYTRYTT
jgi:hypothetical protein